MRPVPRVWRLQKDHTGMLCERCIEDLPDALSVVAAVRPEKVMRMPFAELHFTIVQAASGIGPRLRSQ